MPGTVHLIDGHQLCVAPVVGVIPAGAAVGCRGARHRADLRVAARVELIAVAESVQAAQPDDVVVIEVGSSSSAMHRMVGSVAVNLARHSPVPVIIVP